jgi:hypothetical protein
MLALEDIQHFLISRPPALAARYEFLAFRRSGVGREWLKGILDKVGTAKRVSSGNPGTRWVTIGSRGMTCERSASIALLL